MNYLNLAKSTKPQLAIILILTFIAYSNIFQNGFIGDDINLILNWDFIRHLENIPKALTSNAIPEPYFRFRPLETTMLIIYYRFFGPNPFFYHLHSLAAYFIDIILIYLITKKIVSSIMYQVSRKKPIIHNTYYIIPFLTALLFALHPLHSESVTEILVSLDGTGYIFLLASFYLYLRSSQKPSAISHKPYAFSVALALVSYFSYEITLVLPLLILWYDFCFKPDLFKSLKLSKLFKSLKTYLPFFAGAAFYLVVKFNLSSRLSQAHYLADSFYLTMLTMTHVFLRYLKLLIWPMDLSKNPAILPGVQVWIDPFTNISSITSQSMLNPDILFNIAVISVLVILGIKSFKKNPLVSFAIGWFFISLLPVSYILPQDTLMQERYIFLGVFSFALILAFSVSSIMYHVSRKKPIIHNTYYLILICSLLLFVSFYIYRIYTRNLDFKDQIAYYSKIVSQNPNHIVSNFMLASAYEQKEEDNLALKYYERTLKLEPNIPNIYFRIGEIYQKHNQFKEAAYFYEKVLTLIPDDPQAKSKLNEINQQKSHE